MSLENKENDIFSSNDPDGFLEFKHDELEQLEQQITISSLDEVYSSNWTFDFCLFI